NSPFSPRLLAGLFAASTLLFSVPDASATGVLDRLRNSIGSMWGQSATEREAARKARAQAQARKKKSEATHERLEKAQQLLVRANGVFLQYSYQAKQAEARIVETRHRVQIVTARYKRHKGLFGQRLASVQRNGQLSY